MLILGADVGVTNTKTVLVDRQGEIFATMNRPTLARKGRDAMIERLILTLKDTVKKAGANMKDVAGVGIGFAGPLDPGKGIVFTPLTLPEWLKVPLRDMQTQKLNMPEGSAG